MMGYIYLKTTNHVQVRNLLHVIQQPTILFVHKILDLQATSVLMAYAQVYKIKESRDTLLRPRVSNRSMTVDNVLGGVEYTAVVLVPSPPVDSASLDETRFDVDLFSTAEFSNLTLCFFASISTDERFGRLRKRLNSPEPSLLLASFSLNGSNHVNSCPLSLLMTQVYNASYTTGYYTL